MASKNQTEPTEGGVLSTELTQMLGARRSASLRRVMRLTGLPPEAVLDLAFELVDIAARKIALPPIRRKAVGLGAARWRHVSPAERSEELRRVVQARWAKERRKAEAGED
jgi:hypothetical protein